MKTIQYFPHEVDAIDDIRLQKLIMKMTYEGIGFYWRIVEMLYKNNGYIMLSECESIAFALHTECDKIQQLISLVFEKDTEKFWSNRVLFNLNEMKIKSLNAKKAAEKKWENESKKSNATKNTYAYAHAMQPHSSSNAIKENKINKIKEIDIESYFTNPSEETINKFHEKINASKEQIKAKSEDLLYWWRGLSTKRKKDYSDPESIFRNALKRDFGLRIKTQEFNPDLPVEQVSPEKLAEFRKKRSELLGKKTIPSRNNDQVSS